MTSSHPSKRRRLTQEKEISPPPFRRKVKSQDDPAIYPATVDITSLTQRPSISEPQAYLKPEIDTKNRFEVISWNVNGIFHLLPPTSQKITSFFRKAKNANKVPVETDDDSSDAASSLPSQKSHQSPLREFLKRHNFPQMLCLQEVKISPRDESTKSAVERAANLGVGDEGPRYEVYFSLPRDRFNATGWGGKVYGVCTLIRSDVLSSQDGIGEVVTRAIDWDLEGRVLVTEIRKWRLVVVNGYWVNGTSNTWRDSSTGVVRGTRHDAKRWFNSQMLNEVKKYETGGWDVVLVGGMNVARSLIDGFPGIRLGLEHVQNRLDFNTKFFGGEGGMKGTDSWRYVHGQKRGYTYHGEKAEEWGRSCDRVDLGIVGRGLVERGALIGADIWESLKERGESDHVPIGILIDAGKLEKGLHE